MSKQIRGQPRKVVFPLSSRRLKLYQLQQLAQALELPTSASSDDLRVMVEEKLRAMDRNPLNTQARSYGLTRRGDRESIITR